MNVVFSLRKDQKSKNGLAVIYWYVSYNSKRSKKYSTGIRVNEKFWKQKYATGQNAKPVNDALDNLRADLSDLYNQKRNTISHIQEIADEYNGVGKVHLTFLQLYDLLVEKKKNEKRKEATIDTYITFRNIWLKQYLKSIKNENILADDFSYIHLEGIYELMLKSDSIDSNDYIKHQLSKIRATVKLGYSKGLIQQNRVALHEINIEPDNKEYVYLDIEDIKQLEQLTFLEEESILKRDRDLFLLQCYTGLSFNELIHFKKSNLKFSDGWTWIEVNRGKTNGLQLIPLFDKSLEILKEFDYVLPKLLQHKYNPNIRVCAYRANIKKYLHSHIGRTTAGAFLLNKGVSLQVVSRFLGHKSVKTTEKYYAKIIDTWRVKDEFNRVFRPNS